MTRLLFYDGGLFRIIVSLSAYGIVVLYSHDFNVIVSGGFIMAAAMFMMDRAVQMAFIPKEFR
jgi:hypothetical protein